MNLVKQPIILSPTLFVDSDQIAFYILSQSRALELNVVAKIQTSASILHRETITVAAILGPSVCEGLTMVNYFAEKIIITLDFQAILEIQARDCLKIAVNVQTTEILVLNETAIVPRLINIAARFNAIWQI